MHQWLKKHFPIIDENVNRIGYWSAFFTALWAIMTGIASTIAPITSFGFGVTVFTGLGISCLLILVMSAALAAWRFFKPKELAKLATPASDITNQLNRDVLILLNFAVYESTVLMLHDLLQAAPTNVNNGPLQLGGDFALQNAASHEFVERVRRKLDPGSHRRSEFEGVMQNAAHTAEREVEQTPMEQRPNGIDPLLLRRWAITHLQCVDAISFLKYQKEAAEEILLGQRSGLLERYSLRN